jgi:DNA-binding NtrC family response regulator
LRLFEEREFEPIGSNRTHKVDARILLATNCDLAREVKEGRFREDLYYRINVVTVEMPPLHERLGDILLLADHFLRAFSERHGCTKLGINQEAQRLLEGYDWPGNIRELENVMEHATLLCDGPTLAPIDLPSAVRLRPSSQGAPSKAQSLRSARAALEKRLIREALQANGWNRTRTAKILEINRTTLYKKMIRYGLDKEAADLGR